MRLDQEASSTGLGKELLVNRLHLLTEGPQRTEFGVRIQQFAGTWVERIWRWAWELALPRADILNPHLSLRRIFEDGSAPQQSQNQVQQKAASLLSFSNFCRLPWPLVGVVFLQNFPLVAFPSVSSS